MKNYTLPRTDGCAIRQSLSVHSEYVSNVTMEEEELEAVVEETLQMFRKWQFIHDSDFDSWFERWFRVALSEIEMTSTPGSCIMSSYGATNGEALGWNGIRFDPSRIRLLKAAVRVRFADLLQGKPSADDIQLFVKQEVHKKSKVAEGRYRLISSVSLVDQMVDRILFGPIQKNMLKTVGETPCMAGWSPLMGGYRLMNGRFTKPFAVDRRAWDWTVPPWIVDAWERILIRLCVLPFPGWEGLVRTRFKALFDRAIFRTRDGFRVRGPGRCVMKSGCYLTILLNSIAQTLMHVAASRRLGWNPRANVPWSMGDDTIQEEPEDIQAYLDALEMLGQKIKEWNRNNDFAGFKYDGEIVEPLYWDKHCYMMHIAPRPIREDLYLAYQMLYALAPVEKFNKIQGLTARHDPSWVLRPLSVRSWFRGSGADPRPRKR